MSEANIIKEYKKLYFDFKGKDILKDTYLLSDSKGLCLKEVLPNQCKKKFHILAEKGANVNSDKLIEKLLRSIKKADEPVILIWFGTCEITEKEGKYISIRKYPYQNIEVSLSQYRDP
jgi:rRNA pseudouridine-1189 N-methylase Emg1 (Nep1/Mra1 family)